MTAHTGADPDEELVVLLDRAHRPAGTMRKILVHGTDTPLHLAFSCYVFDALGRLLVTRRALGKRAWPGVWTNSCCGHPGPGETPVDAVRRRLADELGVDAAADRAGRRPRAVLPEFSYRARDAGGIVENEVCPVFALRMPEQPAPAPRPDPAEVADWRWVEWADFVQLARRTPWALSPWSVLQVAQLVGRGWAPPELG